MESAIQNYNNSLSETDKEICDILVNIINQNLKFTENKIWHAHPVWFIESNPIVGFSKQKSGIKLMFWSGMSFEEELLKPGSGKFQDASISYTSLDQIIEKDIVRWLVKSENIQWDYKNIVKRKGVLLRLK
jgi:hypothetical protein